MRRTRRIKRKSRKSRRGAGWFGRSDPPKEVAFADQILANINLPQAITIINDPSTDLVKLQKLLKEKSTPEQKVTLKDILFQIDIKIKSMQADEQEATYF